MDEKLIAVIFACIAVVSTIVWLVLGVRGVRTLEDIRKELTRRRNDSEPPPK